MVGNDVFFSFFEIKMSRKKIRIIMSITSFILNRLSSATDIPKVSNAVRKSEPPNSINYYVLMEKRS